MLSLLQFTWPIARLWERPMRHLSRKWPLFDATITNHNVCTMRVGRGNILYRLCVEFKYPARGKDGVGRLRRDAPDAA